VAISTRVREESGFGLVELLIAMTVMIVGITALVAAMSSGFVAVKRAGDESAAAALADTQFEAYRALPNCAIYLNSPPSSGAYTADPAYPVSPETNVVVSNAWLLGSGTCTAPTLKLSTPEQTLLGADGRSYAVTTYVVRTTSPPRKRVTLVVRDATNTKVLLRETSFFAPPTGCKNDATKGEPVPQGC
jgi:type II secretory pathway pseudopilin PulG